MRPIAAPTFRVDDRRTGWLFVSMLAGELLLLASGVPAQNGQGTFLHAAGLRMMAPLAETATGARDSVVGIRENFAQRSTLLAENRELKARVTQLELERLRMDGLEAEVTRLASAVGYVRGNPTKPRLATIVYLDRSSFLRSLILHAGEGRLAVDQPVLSNAGLVGRIVQVAGTYARAQLITDSAAGVSAMIERNRSQGLVRGAGDGRLTMDYVLHQVSVEPGDQVITAGIDGVFPPGVLIGTVTEVALGEELFHRITLEPAVDFSRLQHVFVVDRQELPKELKSQELSAAP